MRSRLTCLLLLACLPALLFAHEREAYPNGVAPTTFAHERENLDLTSNSERIEDIKLQSGDPVVTQTVASNDGVETFGASDRASLLEDVQSQLGDPLSTQDMVSSNEEKLKDLRRRISTSYEVNVEGLREDAKGALRTSQSAWETFVESTCEVEGDRESGSITPVLNTSCQVRESQRRLDWLDTL